MKLDLDRLQAILKEPHSYYAGGYTTRDDERWSPGYSTDLMSRQLTPASRVLDLGCGKGHILMEMALSFGSGLGVDNDPEFIQMAEDAKREEGITNVDFLLLDFPKEAERLQAESFDLVYSNRGPLGDSAEQFRAAHRLLRPDGLIFCEEIAERHYHEISAIFEPHPSNQEKTSRVSEVRAMMDASGFELRLSADLLTKRYYPDFYSWFAYICNLWTWLGVPLPQSDDPRLALFAEHNTTPHGEIKVTAHTCWVAGVKV